MQSNYSFHHAQIGAAVTAVLAEFEEKCISHLARKGVKLVSGKGFDIRRFVDLFKQHKFSSCSIYIHYYSTARYIMPLYNIVILKADFKSRVRKKIYIAIIIT